MRGDAQELVLLALQPLQLADVATDRHGAGDDARGVANGRTARQQMHVVATDVVANNEADIGAYDAAQRLREREVLDGDRPAVEIARPYQIPLGGDRLQRLLHRQAEQRRAGGIDPPAHPFGTAHEDAAWNRLDDRVDLRRLLREPFRDLFDAP